MNLLLCELSWQCAILTGWIATMSAVVIVLVCYYLLRYYVLPKQNAKYESKMKKEAFVREVCWKIINNPTESQKKLEECRAELDELKKKKKDLDNDTESLKQEKEKFDKEILETKIKAYEEIIKNIKG